MVEECFVQETHAKGMHVCESPQVVQPLHMVDGCLDISTYAWLDVHGAMYPSRGIQDIASIYVEMGMEGHG